MSIPRRIREYRPVVILCIIVALSLASLASGTRSNIISRGLKTSVSVISYPFLKAMSAVSHAKDYAVGFVLYYDDTVQENGELRRQQADLLTQTKDRKEILTENARLRKLLEFERPLASLALEPVEIVGGAFELEGTLLVDRGSWHGIKVGMCAMTPDGVVGRVTDVGPFISSVSTLQKADCRISAMIRRNRVRGIVRGSGSSLTPICTLDYIDIKEDVKVGDEVVTSPESQFPAGYPIGKIVAVHGGEDSDERALLKSAEVKPAANPYHLDELFVVRRGTPSHEELAGAAQIEVAPAGKAGPDSKTMQERYAP
ncbi:MAG: rod shape-determining protein MreC [Candidatus Hydrogenedentes bacterium]|nr:rod shape-determining protein MreC [Candidatus Hydrogenedentota bacterium]